MAELIRQGVIRSEDPDAGARGCSPNRLETILRYYAPIGEIGEYARRLGRALTRAEFDELRMMRRDD